MKFWGALWGMAARRYNITSHGSIESPSDSAHKFPALLESIQHVRTDGHVKVRSALQKGPCEPYTVLFFF